MHFTTPALFALLSSPLLVVAVPNLAIREAISDEYAAKIAESLKQPGVTFDASLLSSRAAEQFSALETRKDAVLTNVGTLPTNKNPECSDDPSYVKKESVYKVDQGIKVAKKGSDDPCTTGTGNSHCWSEQWWVESEIVFDNWENTGFAIDCAKTSTCSSTTVQLDQSCTTRSTSYDNGFEQGIEAKLEFAAPVATKPKFTLGTNPKYSFKQSKLTGTQTCMTESGQAQCSFDDKKCHSVWAAQRNIKVYGYIARVCVGQGNTDNVQRNEKNANGRWVHGILDFSFTVPVNKMVGCGAMCSDQVYPDPTPKEGNGKIPIEIS